MLREEKITFDHASDDFLLVRVSITSPARPDAVSVCVTHWESDAFISLFWKQTSSFLNKMIFRDDKLLIAAYNGRVGSNALHK